MGGADVLRRRPHPADLGRHGDESVPGGPPRVGALSLRHARVGPRGTDGPGHHARVRRRPFSFSDKDWGSERGPRLEDSLAIIQAQQQLTAAAKEHSKVVGFLLQTSEKADAFTFYRITLTNGMVVRIFTLGMSAVALILRGGGYTD